jgi:hypothetical protein
MDHCFKRFSLDGEYLETIHLPGCMVCRPVIHGENLYAGVCWSKTEGRNHLKNNPSGFVVILDAQNKLVSAPCGTMPQYDAQGRLMPVSQELPDIIDHGHDVCVLGNGDMIVCQWNANQTYPIKLKKI